MLTIQEAAKIGISAYIDKIGLDFVRANRNNGTSAYGEGGGSVFCFAGVDDKPWVAESSDTLILDSTPQFPYHASCNVCLNVSFRLDYYLTTKAMRGYNKSWMISNDIKQKKCNIETIFMA